jgi:hypothetical protein
MAPLHQRRAALDLRAPWPAPAAPCACPALLQQRHQPTARRPPQAKAESLVRQAAAAGANIVLVQVRWRAARGAGLHPLRPAAFSAHPAPHAPAPPAGALRRPLLLPGPGPTVLRAGAGAGGQRAAGQVGAGLPSLHSGRHRWPREPARRPAPLAPQARSAAGADSGPGAVERHAHGPLHPPCRLPLQVLRAGRRAGRGAARQLLRALRQRALQLPGGAQLPRRRCGPCCYCRHRWCW